MPGDEATQKLTDLARGGIEVIVLTNALEATDVPIVHAGYAKRRKALLEAGVRLFEMRGYDAAASPKASKVRGSDGLGSTGSSASTALHAKTFVVDGERAFVGSFNFDPRSWKLNTEMGFAIESTNIALHLDERLKIHAPERAYEVKLSEDGSLY